MSQQEPQGSPKEASAADDGSAIHPFLYTPLHATCCQTLKMIIVGLFLFPIRALLFIWAFFMFWLFSLFMLCCTSKEEAKQFPLRRPILRFFLRCMARVILWCFGYWWICVDDQRKKVATPTKASGGGDAATPLTAGMDPNHAPIIIANHVTFVDAFYLAYAEAPMCVAKAELFKAPVLGTIAIATQTIGVSRESAKARHGVVEEIERRTSWRRTQPKHVLDKHGDWPPLLIFPEATCTNTSSIIQFKEGAFNPMLPVQPMCLDYRQKYLDVSWVGQCNVPLTMIRMMCQVYNSLQVTYLPIMRAEPANDTPKLFAKRCQAAMASSLGVSVTDHNFLDVLLVRELRHLRLPTKTANLQMGSYPDGLDYAKEKLRQFAEVDKNRDGTLDVDEFGMLLGFKTEEERKENKSIINALLAHWDKDKDGKINFREFLLFSSALKTKELVDRRKERLSGRESPAESVPMEKGSEDEELRHTFAMCFGAFDIDHDGRVNKDELLASVQTIAPHIAIDEVGKMFDQIDANGDGVVSMDEYLDFCAKQPYLVSSLLYAISMAPTHGLDARSNSEEMAQISRENSFISTDEDGSVRRQFVEQVDTAEVDVPPRVEEPFQAPPQ